ncbi:MAG: zinc-dependent metalloprotease [Pirellulaceae bacterium]
MPEWFIGPLLADLVAHEVGHTLGLRHNFKASSVHSLDEINSEDLKGKKTFTGSVMDYIPINFRLEAGQTQGDYAMIDIGPYDYWAIEYGYTMADAELPKILQRCSEPELQYATDEDTSGPDPLARRYDFSRDPLDYANEQMKLVQLYRSRILDKFVKEGDSWAKARRGYELTLSKQTSAVSMMAGWIGGAFVHRDKKGDPNDRKPIEVVPAGSNAPR